jgi:hypothetical protein
MSDAAQNPKAEAKIEKTTTPLLATIPEEHGFRNYYRCPYDGALWIAEWSCMCNDRCPICRAEIEPHDSEGY